MNPAPEPIGVTQALREFRAGNKESFAALVERYRGRLERCLERRLGRYRTGLNTNEDLAQSVFRRLYGQLTANATWLQSVATTDEFEAVLFHGAALRLLRAIQYEDAGCRRGTVHDQDVGSADAPALSATFADRDANPADEVAADQLVEEWKARIAQVNPKLVPIFEFRVQGRTPREIADLTARSVGKVYDGLRIIRRIIARMTEQEWAEREDGHDA